MDNVFFSRPAEDSDTYTDVAVISNLSIHIKVFLSIYYILCFLKTVLQVEKALVVDGSDRSPDVQDSLFFEGR